MNVDNTLPLVSVDNSSDHVEVDSRVVFEVSSSSDNPRVIFIMVLALMEVDIESQVCRLKTTAVSATVPFTHRSLCAEMCTSAGVEGRVSPHYVGFRPVLLPGKYSGLFILK